MMEISKKSILIPMIIVLMLSAVFNISAESIWEGSAAMGRYGEFPFTGFYGASNSFPQNAYVEVENLENGKRTRLIVVNRLSDPGLLLLVSNDAAQELGIYQNDIARIQVRLISTGSTAEAPHYDDLAYNPDPDLNPAAALINPEEQVYQDIEAEAVTEPAETEVAETEVAETEIWDADESEPAAETESPAFTEAAPETDGLLEAEVLVTETEVPADIVSDSPEKPYDWPDSRGEPEPESEPEPLYLTMDDLEEGVPADEADPAVAVHSPDTDVLWPKGETEKNEEIAVVTEEPAAEEPAPEITVEAEPEPEKPEVVEQVPAKLELVSSGLSETTPVYTEDEDFKLSMLPEIVEKKEAEDAEYLTGSSDYYSPSLVESAVSTAALPAPEPEFPEVPEEVIAVLVGDHIQMAETEPETETFTASYIDSPALALDGEDAVIVSETLAEAVPEAVSRTLTAEAVPDLPRREESVLVEVADGYIAPGKADYTVGVSDYPNPNAAAEMVDVPKTDDELAYAEAPEAEGIDNVPEMTELPEVAEAVSGEDEAVEEVDMTVPEYDENLEVTLVPAEVRPPELVEEETALAESEPEEVVEPEVAEVEHSPAVEVEVAAAEPEPAPEPEPEPELTVPDQIMMVSKLQQKKHYLQLGAFKEKNSAIRAAGRLDAAYPVTILTDEAASGVNYKLLLGPLTADESGLMLYNFRAGGYSDAFIRRIE